MHVGLGHEIATISHYGKKKKSSWHKVDDFTIFILNPVNNPILLPALFLSDGVAHLLIDRLHTGLALLIIDSVAHLHVDHLTLLLGDGLSHGLTLLLQFAVTALLVHDVASLVNDSVALLLTRLAAHLIDDIGALLGHALITDLMKLI